uniref:Uncharacterized protein n=1 Tax=Anguilla anguilla TaxID=7936 RepID=A0A0E9XC81_ANGAN
MFFFKFYLRVCVRVRRVVCGSQNPL